jgi:predicted AAA+ superfamily ATPase
MERLVWLEKISDRFAVQPVVGLLGPRQCGKTTLARAYAERHPELNITRFDLEDPLDLAALSNPRLALQDLRGLVIIDEIQRAPELFPLLRVLVDRPQNPAQFLVLGSASRDLLRQSSETLAGRIGYIELTPFSLTESGQDTKDQLWMRGGFPPAFLAASETASHQWRKDYIATFLERDIPALGITIAPQSLRRFWTMLAHYHGQIVNFSELGRSFGAADTTIRRYMDILEATFMVRQLRPWHENISKRQVKAPKLYFRDSGILHSLLEIPDKLALTRHPKLGASWEGFALEEVIRAGANESENLWFWATHGGAELDLLVIKGTRREGFEFKYTDRPATTRSMHIAIESLNLERLTVIYPGERRISLTEKIEAIGLAEFVQRTSTRVSA